MKRHVCIILAIAISLSSILADIPQDFLNSLQNNDYESVNKLIAQGIDLNAVDQYGNTALIYAAGACSSNIVELLIRNGANVNRAAYDGFTALMNAACYNQTENANILCNYGARIDSKTDMQWTALDFAIANQNVQMCNYLINKGSDLYNICKADDGVEFSIIRVALSDGNDEILNLLIEAGIDVNRADSYGFFPLHYAAVFNKSNSVRLLIRAGANKECRDKTDMATPLMYAALCFSYDVIPVLTMLGVDSNNIDSGGRNAFFYPFFQPYSQDFKTQTISESIARLEGDLNLQDVIIETIDKTILALKTANVDINQHNVVGETPIMLAIWNGFPVDVIKTLIDNGADYNARNMEGKSVLDYAYDYDADQSVKDYLESIGALRGFHSR